jgi:hypothetical protein
MLLALCRGSVMGQGCKDCEQVILEDTEGLGAGGSHKLFYDAPVKGDYVYVLDDDDMLADINVVESIKGFIESQGRPPFIVVRVRHPYTILPEMEYWGCPRVPPYGHIGSGGVVTRRDVWLSHRDKWTLDYHGDHNFIESLFRDYPAMWYNIIAVKVSRRGVDRIEM